MRNIQREKKRCGMCFEVRENAIVFEGIVRLQLRLVGQEVDRKRNINERLPLVEDTLIVDRSLAGMTIIDTLPVDLALCIEGSLLVCHLQLRACLLCVPDLTLAETHVIVHNPDNWCG